MSAPPDGRSAINDLGLERYSARPLTMDDSRGVFELMAAEELEGLGEVAIEEADIIGDWQRPSFDLTSQTIGVLAGDRLVGYAEVATGGRADASVAVDHRGRGIGTALARWTRRVAGRDGSDSVGMPVLEGSPGEALLRGLGYRVRWTSWVLALPGGSGIEPQPVPDGYGIRQADGEQDHHRVHEVVEDAFLEWADRDRESFEDFAAVVTRRPGFEPWNIRLMTDPGGEVVGACIVQLSEGCGYVSRLAVRRDQRGLGLARALLVDSFAAAREHCATRSEVATDSRTGALGLYEKVGMVVTSTWLNLAIDTSGRR